MEDFKALSVFFNFSHWGARKTCKNFKMGLGLALQVELFDIWKCTNEEKWQFVNLEPNWVIDSFIIHMVRTWEEFIVSSFIVYHVIVYKIYIEMTKTCKSLDMTPQIKTCSVLKLWSLLNSLKPSLFWTCDYIIL